MRFIKITIIFFSFIAVFAVAQNVQAATNVYYSVGQSAANHSSGGNVAITSGVATFTVPQTATNLGVGDRLTYDGQVAYLASKISSVSWNVVMALGVAPADYASTAVTSITHEYTSLSAAEAGAADVNHLNNTDLTAADVILNLPCYYDSGADTTAITVDGWTTDATRYIKIYTPNLSTEANQSQRHSGKWDDNKYRISIATGDSLLIQEENVKIQGLQIDIFAATAESEGIYFYGATGICNYEASYNIIRGTVGGNTSEVHGIVVYNSGAVGSVSKIYNNIIYDFKTGSTNYVDGIALWDSDFTHYVYNNTVTNCYVGIEEGEASTFIAKNNISYDNTIDYSVNGGSFSVSSTNNLSKDATAPAYNAYYRNVTVNFVDATNKDFHLANTDTGARGKGISLMSDANLAFQSDIDGEERSGLWSIGADQYQAGTMQNEQSQSITSGLVLYQSFDGADISGTNAYDRSGNNNNGAISGATPVIGKIGQTLSFDGNNDEILIGKPASLNDLSTFTLAAWIYPRSLGAGGRGRIFNKATNNVGGNGWYFNVSNYGDNNLNSLRFERGCSGGDSMELSTEANSITLNEWQYVVLTWDGTNQYSGTHVYRNGIELTKALTTSTTYNGSTSPASDAGSDLRIGNSSVGDRDFDGFIDEARIYNRVLSATEVANLYRTGFDKINASQTDKAKNGLVLLQSFDGQYISGTTAVDSSGQGNNGWISGATPTIGKIGQALNFSGTGNYVNVGSGASLDNLNTLTYVAWIKPNSLSGNKVILSKDGYKIFFLKDNKLCFFVKESGDSDYYICSQNTISAANQWVYVAIDFDGETTFYTVSKFYINGIQSDFDVVTFGSDTMSNDAASDQSIGKAASTFADFSGQIDEVRIYNRELSADEIGDLYRMGQAKIKR